MINDVLMARMPERMAIGDPDEKVKVTLTIRRSEKDKLHAWMVSDTWEKAQELRAANLATCTKSLEHCLNFALHNPGTSGGRVFATFLASLYNGERVKADVSDLRLLDSASFEHVMNVMRLCFETSMEPHQFFADGGRLFEELIENWGLEKKRRARR